MKNLESMDIKLNQFNSNDIKTLLDFYSTFSDRKELVKWVRSIPKSTPKIQKAGNEDSQIAVIIPTPTLLHPLAINCQNNIFNDLNIIFSIDNSVLFNLSHSYNHGAKVLSKEPNVEWVIFSNVDMFQIDQPTILQNELTKLNGQVKLSYAKEDGSHSYQVRIGEYTYLRKILFNLFGKTRKIRSNLENKFSIHMNAEDVRSFFFRNFVTNAKNLLNFGDFFIFSIDLLKNFHYEPFDEMYLNGMEDIDLSLRLFSELTKDEIVGINYRIGSMESGVRGRGLERIFRSIPSLAYFNEKLENIKYKW